ncbi:MAG: AI-2E family transporter [bacterium]|nr:AI-2E family transporter [bacterium]
MEKKEGIQIINKKNSYFALQENKVLKTLFYSLFLVIIVSLIYIFRYYLWPFLFAIILYVALKPLHDTITKYVKSRTLSSNIVILALFLLILVPLFFLLLSLAGQISSLTEQISSLLKDGEVYTAFINKIKSNDFINNAIQKFNINQDELFKNGVKFIQEKAGTAFSNISLIVTLPVNFLINFFFMLLMLFFLLKDGEKLGTTVYKTLPFPDDIEKKVIDRLKEVIKVLLAGNLLIMLLQGFMIGLGLKIAGLDETYLLWGSIAAILSLIPVVGTSLIWLPSVLYLVVTGDYGYAIFVGAWSLSWYLILENLLKPKVFGERLNFHPVLFFFLLLGSIKALSLPGVLIGPILLTLFYSFWEIYKLLDEYDMGKKITENPDSGLAP